MASARYQTIAQGLWPYLGTALKLLDADLRTVETSATGTIPMDRLPAGSVVFTSTVTRPTNRTDLVCMFLGPDPGVNAIGNDVWLGS